MGDDDLRSGWFGPRAWFGRLHVSDRPHGSAVCTVRTARRSAVSRRHVGAFWPWSELSVAIRVADVGAGRFLARASVPTVAVCAMAAAAVSVADAEIGVVPVPPASSMVAGATSTASSTLPTSPEGPEVASTPPEPLDAAPDLAGTVEGCVWSDVNRNGVREPDEPLASLVDIELEIAGDVLTTRSTSGRDDPGDDSACPNYRFGDVPVGDAVVTASLDGWTTPARVDARVDADAVTRVDFGRHVPELYGAAWFDEDEDGEVGADELPATNLSVEVPGLDVVARVTPSPDGSFRLPALSPGPLQPGTTVQVTWHGDRSYAPVLTGTTSDPLPPSWVGPSFGDDDPVDHGFYAREDACASADRRDEQCLLPDLGPAGVAIIRPSFDHEVRADAPVGTVLVGRPLTIDVEVGAVGPYVSGVYDVVITLDASMHVTTTPINICNPAGGGPWGDPVVPCELLVPFVDPNWRIAAPEAPTPPLHLTRGDHLYPPCSDPPCHPYDPVSGPNEPLALGIVPTRPGRFEVIVEVPTSKYGFTDRDPTNNRAVVTIEVLDQLPGTR